MTMWAPVVGFEGKYEVSDDGRVRSVTRFVEYPDRDGGRTFEGRELGGTVSQRGYRYFDLYVAGKQHRRPVSRLMLEAFVGPPPSPKHEACHEDGDRLGNRIGNLRWDTHSANLADRIAHGTHPQASKTHCIRGHEFTEVNTYKSGPMRNRRACRTCSLEAGKRQNERKRAARAQFRIETEKYNDQLRAAGFEPVPLTGVI